MSITKESAEELWRKAENFSPSELQGKYKVKMVETFTWPFHVKLFDQKHKEFCNRICGVKCLEFEMVATGDYIGFYYGILGMYDKLKRVRDGYYIGVFYKCDEFVDFFTLEKI